MLRRLRRMYLSISGPLDRAYKVGRVFTPTTGVIVNTVKHFLDLIEGISNFVQGFEVTPWLTDQYSSELSCSVSRYLVAAGKADCHYLS